MRVLLLIAFIGAARALPQGYNYQFVPALGPFEHSGLSSHQYHQLQQFAEQQQKQELLLPDQQFQQVVAINDERNEDVATISQAISQSAGSGHYQYASQSVGQLAGPQQQLPTSTFELEHHTEPHQPQSELQQHVNIVEQQHHQHHQHQQPEPGLQAPIELPQPHAIRQPLPTYETPCQTVHYNKEFYYLSAPQEDIETGQVLQKELDKIKKNLRVVFIRTPENNGLSEAALQLAKQSIESQTAIYVLSKQHDVAELAGKLQDIRSASRAKPEVIFVKYKTPAEADHAQRTIQAQFEALDGPNSFNHEGVGPTHNFIGSTSGIDPRAGGSESAINLPATKYLPATAKY